MEMWICIIIWAVVLLSALVIEFFTNELVSVWFAIGAVFAMILAACNVDIIIQSCVFAGVAIVLLFVLRPFAKKFLDSKIVRTNADGIIGKIVKIVKEVNQDNIGEVQVGADVWKAISRSNDIFEVGEKVLVEDIEGIKLVVKKINIEEE